MTHAEQKHPQVHIKLAAMLSQFSIDAKHVISNAITHNINPTLKVAKKRSVPIVLFVFHK